MRIQVESELEMATNEIEMLTKRIEQGEINFTMYLLSVPTGLLQETSRGKRRRNGAGPTSKRKFAGQAPPSTVRFRADSDDRDRGNHFLVLTVS